jgi:ketosteroid isomerase-like protein
MISETEARAWIEAYGEAWTTQDPDKIVQLYTRDASYRERRFHPGIRNTEHIWEYWDLIVRELQRDVGFEVVSVAVSGDTAFFNWRSHFTWRPINGVMELDAMSRVQFSSESANGLRLASNFEEWIDHREA